MLRPNFALALTSCTQDVWSRWTGGDGAPAWTLELMGFNISNLHDCGAALTHQGHILEHGSDKEFPKMMWPSNHHKLACGTAFTLFFAGRFFAPFFEIKGKNIQDFLQDHYISAMAAVCKKLADEDNVVGFDSLNEPNMGMIGWHDLTKGSDFLLQGAAPTWFESFQVGEGFTKNVANYQPSLVRNGTCCLNPRGLRAWRKNSVCVWRQHGVWDIIGGTPTLLKPDYFRWRYVDGRKTEIDPSNDCFMPFLLRFKQGLADALTPSRRSMVVFIDRFTDFENSSISDYPKNSKFCQEPRTLKDFAWSPHWYDLVPLVLKSFIPWAGVAREQGVSSPIVLGASNLVNEYSRQLLLLKRGGDEIAPNRKIPTIVGEIGIPFDMDNKKSYSTGNFNTQILAMNTTMQALDQALLSGIIWNYTSDNTNAHGDGWNGEDLSIFSRDQIAQGHHRDVFGGGRALQAIVRPYACRCAGTPLEMKFDMYTRTFFFKFRHDESLENVPTVIFLPLYQYPIMPEITVSDGKYCVHAIQQTLEYYADHASGSEHVIVIESSQDAVP